MSDSPPMTPPDCDLRDFAFMPLDIVRLFGSRFHAVSSDGEWRAGVTLWLKSFHQVPAGSLPVDDVELCRLAELGRDLKSWEELKAGALYGWIRCDDGRLYHPIVAEKVNEAWKRKLAQRARSQKGNEARWGKRSERGRDPGHESESPEGARAGRTSSDGHDREAESEGSGRDVQEESLKESRSLSNTDSNKNSEKESHEQSSRHSLNDSLKDPKGQGQGQGYKKIAAAAIHPPARDPVDNPPPPPAAGVESTAAHFAGLLDRWERERGKAGAFHPGDPLLLAWADAGVTNAELQAAHTKAVKRRVKANDQAPVNVGLLDAILPEVRVKPGVTSAVARAETRQDPAAWALTWSGLVARGAELGIVQHQGELDPLFKARVHTAAGLTDADRARLFADYGVRV
ncbi:DUF1376 domain-containing protein [Achromobacter insolitus]|uniref:DUF1376 domain-containing protein n=1 Tax=Achromobacter insolitus TaxID=217204 RepID=UPI0028ABB880|nr:DUF1376 domain-containing protein [Achromobacter insolitus]